MVAALLGYRPQVGVLFFICVYVHLIRGVYYGSFAQPREAVWLTGWSARGLPCGRWRWWVHLSGEVSYTIHGPKLRQG